MITDVVKKSWGVMIDNVAFNVSDSVIIMDREGFKYFGIISQFTDSGIVLKTKNPIGRSFAFNQIKTIDHFY